MKNILLACAISLLAGCTSSHVPTAPDLIVLTHLTPEHHAATSGLVHPTRIVVHDAATFAALWTGAFGDYPVPMVDFTRQMVIVASMGAQPTGGYLIRVDDVASESGRVSIRIVSAVPGRGCLVTQAPTQPVDFALVSGVSGRIEFHDRTESTVCGHTR